MTTKPSNAPELPDNVETALHKLQSWGKAYPLDMFPEPTKEQRAYLHEHHPGLQDRIAASMGRHIAACIEKDIAIIGPAMLAFRADGVREVRGLVEKWPLDRHSDPHSDPWTLGYLRAKKECADELAAALDQEKNDGR